ncbi:MULTISPECIES: hypothetical protein [Cryobacterium]|uniref:Uncharacterized protein n=1 Tax=Cryobacterium breve TaxID=1259258 RepID=A0ABY2JEP1_9MICO|nr:MULTISPECIES: hypothetical protein [Cryobacterium]TFC94696.1 hypothetical protein E3T20_07365 [Cryobacterium sp. TmT3-12]TFD02122.1 hypothetical protein E3O65_00010 [Cryobacterium breve]
MRGKRGRGWLIVAIILAGTAVLSIAAWPLTTYFQIVLFADSSGDFKTLHSLASDLQLEKAAERVVLNKQYGSSLRASGPPPTLKYELIRPTDGWEAELDKRAQSIGLSMIGDRTWQGSYRGLFVTVLAAESIDANEVLKLRIYSG